MSNADIYGPDAIAAATANGVPPALYQGVIQQESNWNPFALSSSGAYGLAQLMPGTARDLGANMYNPVENLDAGARYLKQMFDRYGNWNDALGAYNAGPGAYDKYKAGTGALSSETQAYIPAVLSKAAAFGYSGDTPATPSTSTTLSPITDAVGWGLGQIGDIAKSILGDPTPGPSNSKPLVVPSIDPVGQVHQALAPVDQLVADMQTAAFWQNASVYVVAVVAIGALVLFGVSKVVKA